MASRKSNTANLAPDLVPTSIGRGTEFAEIALAYLVDDPRMVVRPVDEARAKRYSEWVWDSSLPIVVARITDDPRIPADHYVVLDGRHRLAARRLSGGRTPDSAQPLPALGPSDTILCDIRTVTVSEARMLAAVANTGHGANLTETDKLRVATMVLESCPSIGSWRLSAMLGVSQPTALAWQREIMVRATMPAEILAHVVPQGAVARPGEISAAALRSLHVIEDPKARIMLAREALDPRKATTTDAIAKSAKLLSPATREKDAAAYGAAVRNLRDGALLPITKIVAPEGSSQHHEREPEPTPDVLSDVKDGGGAAAEAERRGEAEAEAAALADMASANATADAMSEMADAIFRMARAVKHTPADEFVVYMRASSERNREIRAMLGTMAAWQTAVALADKVARAASRSND